MSYEKVCRWLNWEEGFLIKFNSRFIWYSIICEYECVGGECFGVLYC